MKINGKNVDNKLQRTENGYNLKIDLNTILQPGGLVELFSLNIFISDDELIQTIKETIKR